MSTENRENIEQENSMDDKRFEAIYRLLQNNGVSKEELDSFIIKYNTGEGDAIRLKDQQQQQEKEERINNKEALEELKKQIPDMTNEELEKYSVEYYGYDSDPSKAINRADKFRRELNKRLLTEARKNLNK